MNAETKDMVFTRTFNAPVELLWQVWTEPELFMQWWAPDNMSCPNANIDFKVGGTSLLCMRAPAEYGGWDRCVTWMYTEITPFERFEYISNFCDMEGKALQPGDPEFPAGAKPNALNSVQFKNLGGQTEVTVTMYNRTVGKGMEMASVGMEQMLNKIERLLAKELVA